MGNRRISDPDEQQLWTWTKMLRCMDKSLHHQQNRFGPINVKTPTFVLRPDDMAWRWVVEGFQVYFKPPMESGEGSCPTLVCPGSRDCRLLEGEYIGFRCWLGTLPFLPSSSFRSPRIPTLPRKTSTSSSICHRACKEFVNDLSSLIAFSWKTLAPIPHASRESISNAKRRRKTSSKDQFG